MAETAAFSGFGVAPGAMFADGSAGCGGNNVGTPAFASEEPSVAEFKRWRRQMGVCADASYTYFAWGERYWLIKIGRTWEPNRREAELRREHHQGVEIVATVRGDFEAAYHSLFAEHRLHGEWFSPHPDILAEIARLQEQSE